MMTQRDEFTSALAESAPHYGVQPGADVLARLGKYYEHLSKWNARLHLVAPCAPAEFATRHVLESLTACTYLPEDARVCDVGSGGGLPIIPCLIARTDISATLVEASTKKAVFLREALSGLELQDRARVIAERFERTPAPEADALTCRALERFTEMYPRLALWSPRASRQLLFGGNTLKELLERDENVRSFAAVKMPDSEQRFLFVIERKSY
ncbi:MAG TPA: RsmG family class I SAM-dependent methyltransferase [Pyrinomonadaceae bacterium]|nr:RsmG family class I SAM-dependent methyltransferase [Pyrinomonadaceae bacterium]